MKNWISIALIAVSLLAICESFEIKPRIVRGYATEPGQFPYYVFLKMSYGLKRPTERMACGGALLSDEWVVTAAHCIQGSERLVAHFGMTNLLTQSEGRQAVAVEKENYHIYPFHSDYFAWNDIALIYLPQKVWFSMNVMPVKLPTECKYPKNVDAVVMGNGITANLGRVSNAVYYAELKTTELDVCREVFPFIYWRKSVLCAQNKQYPQSICQGDSGSPLVDKSNGEIIGVTFVVRKEGCEQGLPQGFTNIYSYLGWIKDVTGLSAPSC